MKWNTAVIIYGSIFLCTTLQAASFSFTLGSPTPSFANGQVPIGTATYNAAVAGNAAPFNGFIGSDVTGPDFSASWSYSYSPIVGTIASATLMLGLYDADSAAPGNQVALFTLSGTDLTTSLNTSLEALHGGAGAANAEYDILTITLPASTFTALAGGTPALNLRLQGPGLGVLGTTPFNGAGLDFSTLTINTQAAVPEPSACVLAAIGIAAIGWVRFRHRRL
ncbi:MAG: PEP-CTERM sorting domain-containing protein [Acidobacteriaceae bacterium]|nr:PEP-CTERM sorting domain-containing protein [Acidobacteriaceae bacterium]